MDIVSRLKIFLQENGISNSLFADNCNIPRPTLSQLLNGRNKKVSDELIAKIHAAYPALNVMWLMFGDGDMFVPNANMPAAENQTQFADNAIEFNAPNIDAKNATRQTTINFGGGDRSDYHEQSRPSGNVMHNSPIADVVPTMVRASKNGMQRQSAPGEERRVTSIMVYYSDGRFETFVPQNGQ